MNQISDFLGLKILHTSSTKFTAAELKEIDLVEIFPPTEKGFVRPLKISWRKIIDSRPTIEQIRSKRARKHIKADSKKIQGEGIKIQTFPEIDETQFKNWFAFYEAKIKEKEHGRLALQKDWFSEKLKSGKKIGGIFAFKGDQMFGGDLFHESNGRLSASFGVYEDISTLAGSLGLLIDYHFLVEAQRLRYKEVSFGQDTNLYGFHLTPGLMFYKAKLGFSPVPAVKSEYVSTVFLNLKKFVDPIMFFEGKDKLSLIVISDKITPQDIYLPETVKEFKIFTREEIEKMAGDLC